MVVNLILSSLTLKLALLLLESSLKGKLSIWLNHGFT